jgi:hypothetical protein
MEENIYYAKIIDKLSGRGWSYNKRVLKLENSILSYYSKIPKNFASDFLFKFDFLRLCGK